MVIHKNTMAISRRGASTAKWEKFVKYFKKNYDLFLMILPAILVILIFNYLPMYGIQLAFREFRPEKGLTGGEWVGLKYINKFFTSFQFKNLIVNTLSISLASILIGFPIPIVLAILFHQIKNEKLKKIMQTTVYIPHFISTVVMVGMLNVFLAPNTGIVGHFLRSIGLKPVNFMGMPEYFVLVYVLSDVWQHAGWNSIIYIAALSSIDTQLYDAAMIDGANKWQVIWYIEIPGIIPTIIILLVLSMGRILSVGFEKAFLMQNSLNLKASEVISTYVYKIGITSHQYSYSTAIGLFNTVVNFIFLTSMNYLAKKFTDTSLW